MEEIGGEKFSLVGGWIGRLPRFWEESYHLEGKELEFWLRKLDGIDFPLRGIRVVGEIFLKFFLIWLRREF